MLLLTFILGLLVNFIGYVPPGNINLTLVKITINRGFKQGIHFVIAFSAVEFFFTLFIIHAAEWLSNELKLDKVIDWVMIALFTTLGVVTWVKRHKTPKTDYSKYQTVKYGIILGVLNPVQIPFWIISGSYLITHGWIITGTLPLILLSLGSAIGAFACLFLYARFARYIQSRFELSTHALNAGIAVLFFCLALFHVVKQVHHLFFT